MWTLTFPSVSSKPEARGWSMHQSVTTLDGGTCLLTNVKTIRFGQDNLSNGVRDLSRFVARVPDDPDQQPFAISGYTTHQVTSYVCPAVQTVPALGVRI